MWCVVRTGGPGWPLRAAGLNLGPAGKRLNARPGSGIARTGAKRLTTERPPPPRRQESSSTEVFCVDFEQTQEAYRSKDSLELLRSLVVFKLCSYDLLVDKNKEIMDLGQKVLGRRAFEQLMKMTFYGQFVAGEDHHAIRPVLQKNQAFGVGSVLDYSVEEDLSPEENQENMQENQHQPRRSSRKQNGAAGRHHHGDGERSVEEEWQRGAAGRYLHADEAKCDRNVETFLACIRASGGGAMEGFSAVKVTALARPAFLLRLSELLVKWRRFFSFLAALQGAGAQETVEQRLEVRRLQETLTRLGAKGDFSSWFPDASPNVSGTMDVLDWDSLIDSRADASHLLLVPDVGRGELVPLLDHFSAEDENQMKRILQRMDLLAKHAKQNGVRLMVDAEQTYLQPAIRYLTLETQRAHNSLTPLVLNTYQCYLKEAYQQLAVDAARSRRQGWSLGAKLVRGAYMHQERERAALRGYPDPVLPTYQDTNHMYHRCLDLLLEEVSVSRASVMVATHNEDTVRHTLKRMEELGLAPDQNQVSFGQLLGMCDQISFPLGQAGLPVYKYVPYGPVSEVMPYLTRRAQENRGFMKGADRERDLLLKELKRRLASGEIFHRPVF